MSFTYKDRPIEDCIALHVEGELRAGNKEFDNKVITQLLSQICIFKIDQDPYSVSFGSLRCEQLFLSLRAVGPPTCSVPAKTLGLFEGKLRGKYRFHTTYRTIYVIASCN